MRIVWSLALLAWALPAGAAPKVFPEPQQMSVAGADFVVDESVHVLVPPNASAADLRLADLIAAEMAGRHGVAVGRQSAARLPGGRFLLAGSIANPLVRAWCAAHGVDVTAEKPGPEGYVLSAGPDAVVVAGSDERGAFYGVQSLRQLIASNGGKVRVPGVRIRDWPRMAFRGIKLYLPGRDNMAFFKRFVRDYMALYKYNKLIVEMNAAMRLDRHPELNAGWLDLGRDLQLRRQNNPVGLWYHGKNSVHHDTADGGILEKDEVADLVRWAETNYIEVIPELPSLTHSYYLLSRHPELAEIPQEEWPDTYCPSNQAVYKLLFDVYDEYIEVMHPKMVHIGHDEWRMPWGACPLCRNKDPRELFAQDVNRIHTYLKGKGVRAAMWSDHLLENVRGAKFKKPWWDAHEYTYPIPGALSPEQVKALIPKDILMFNWMWGYTADPKFPPVSNEQRLSDWGFESVYANFEASIPDFGRRIAASPKIIGGVPSSWAATTEFNFGKDLVGNFSGCEALVWRGTDQTAAARTQDMDALMPEIRRNLSGRLAPSATDAVTPVSLGAALNADVAKTLDAAGWKAGQVSRGRLVFDLATGGNNAVVVGSQGTGEARYPRGPAAVSIGSDASSIVFLHALAKPADSTQAYRTIYDFADTADLLGWYEVEYEDGLVDTIPLRYGWNILDWRNRRGRTAYDADRVDAGNGVSLYAFEWVNPRMGKAIREVRLKGSHDFRNARGTPIPSNAIVLAGVSVVPKRVKPAQANPPFPPN